MSIVETEIGSEDTSRYIRWNFVDNKQLFTTILGAVLETVP
jgi:hypothetical protein